MGSDKQFATTKNDWMQSNNEISESIRSLRNKNVSDGRIRNAATIHDAL